MCRNGKQTTTYQENIFCFDAVNVAGYETFINNNNIRKNNAFVKIFIYIGKRFHSWFCLLHIFFFLCISVINLCLVMNINDKRDFFILNKNNNNGRSLQCNNAIMISFLLFLLKLKCLFQLLTVQKNLKRKFFWWCFTKVWIFLLDLTTSNFYCTFFNKFDIFFCLTKRKLLTWLESLKYWRSCYFNLTWKQIHIKEEFDQSPGLTVSINQSRISK